VRGFFMGWMPFLSPNQQCHAVKDTRWSGLIVRLRQKEHLRTFENQLYPIALANTGHDTDGEWFTTVSKMAVYLRFFIYISCHIWFCCQQRTRKLL